MCRFSCMGLFPMITNAMFLFMFATLGVYPLHYLPFAFMNLSNPLISIFYGYTGITMTPADPVPSSMESDPPPAELH